MKTTTKIVLGAAVVIAVSAGAASVTTYAMMKPDQKKALAFDDIFQQNPDVRLAALNAGDLRPVDLTAAAESSVHAVVHIKSTQSAKKQNVVVLTGDGELNEGSNWEAIMFAQQHNLDNLTLIVDYNKVSMLDFSKNIINMNSLNKKFEAFNWDVYEVKDGHDIEEVYSILKSVIETRKQKPKVVIVNTIKGKGAPFLETHALSHILSLKSEDIDSLIKEIENAN